MTPRAERVVENMATDKGEFVERSFIVNKRTPAITLADSVRINPREVGTMTWDDKLTLEFTGPAPAVAEVTVEPVGDVTTVFLCGNSIRTMDKLGADNTEVLQRRYCGGKSCRKRRERGVVLG